MTEQAARARPVAPGFQTVHITVRDGYRPHTIVAHAGVPLRLVFHRDEDATCSERVVFSSPRLDRHLDRHLAPHGATVVELPAQGPGEVRFTCAMGRYRGLIRLSEEQAAPDPAGRRRPIRPVGAMAAVVLVLVAAGLLSAAAPTLGAAPLLAALATIALAAWLAVGRHMSDSLPQPHKH